MLLDIHPLLYNALMPYARVYSEVQFPADAWFCVVVVRIPRLLSFNVNQFKLKNRIPGKNKYTPMVSEGLEESALFYYIIHCLCDVI